jgi:8-oxo-dGTP pyrophosphatase MutT (NUDIX family)
MTTPRPKNAASLVILRKDGGRLSVLMGHRHAGHVFLPNLWVFPGGRVERKDYRAEALGELSTETLEAITPTARPSLARALAICAVRETFEETGVLLGADGLPDLSCLRLAAREITPPGHPRRFDTHFFTAPAEAAASVDLGSGDGEFDGIAWIAVDEVDARAPHPVTRRVLDKVLAGAADGN